MIKETMFIWFCNHEWGQIDIGFESQWWKSPKEQEKNKHIPNSECGFQLGNSIHSKNELKSKLF